MKKIFMFVPAFGQQITAATFMTTHALQQKFTEKSIHASIATLSFPDIAELRSMAMTIWYDTMPDTEYMLFIDSDMGFSPDMVTDMMLFGEPLVGAIYPQRNLPVSWAGSGTGEATTARRGNFMLVEGVGFGCTLMRRDMVTRMIEKFPELVDTRIDMQPYGKILRSAGAARLIRLFDKMNIPERGWVSEDLSFCIRHRACGGEVWAAVGYRISHVGPYDYGQCYLEHTAQMQAQAEQQEAFQRQMVEQHREQMLQLQAPQTPFPLAVPIVPDVLREGGAIVANVLPLRAKTRTRTRKPRIAAYRAKSKSNGRAAHR